jgi:membrane fusion protein, macrolide-specific efflux system
MPASPFRPSVAVNAAVTVLLVAGGVWAYQIVSGPGGTAAANAASRTVPVQQGTVTASVTADGSVESVHTASTSFVTGGPVTAIDVHVGQLVKKGQRLARVAAGAADRSLAEAQANLTAAQDALTRAQDAGGDTTDATNQVTQAQLAVDDAQAAVDGTVLTAPMTGTVVAINGQLGSSSSGSASGSGSGSGSGQSGSGSGGSSSSASTSSSSTGSGGFIDLADLTTLQVSAAFAEADATRLKTGQAATVTWNALSGTVQGGTVAAIDPQATTSNNVVTYGVTVKLGSTPAGAKPGQTVTVAVVTGEARNAIYVNSAAVTTFGNRHTVTVVSGGRQQVEPVEVGLVGDTTTQILSGLRVGQQVLVNLASSTSGSGTGFPGGGVRIGGGLGGFGGGGARTGAGGGATGRTGAGGGTGTATGTTAGGGGR